MNARLIKIFQLIMLIFFIGTPVYSENSQFYKSIEEIVASASDCEILAYHFAVSNYDADEVFKGCVEVRAILIGMQKKYGPGKYGEIDVYDKIQGFSYLANSTNELVKKEAEYYATAIGFQE